MSRWLDKIFVLTGIFALLVTSQEAHLSTESPSQVFIDCYPQPGPSKELCELRGCTWKHVTKHDFSKYTTWGMFSRDENPTSATNNTYNLYSVHPFYMGLEKDGKAHGVFILNSNAQEVTTGPGPHMIYRTIGGELEIFYFPGPKPEDVIKQYEQVIGKPMLPAYWAFGFQLCRWGYQGLEEVKQVVARTRNAGIPFDVQYADIDYMDRYKDFTLDTQKWGDLPEYTNFLHENGLHLILIFDPAIQVDDDSFARAKRQNVAFIEWPRKDLVPRETQEKYPLANDTNIMLGVVWPDRHVAFPDFLDQTHFTNDWWTNELAHFHSKVPYDGIWIDMNEPTNFGTNEETPWYYNFLDHPSIEPLKCPIVGADSNLDVPPYQTVNVYQWPENTYLSTKTFCMLASTMRGQSRFYDTKNLYGWSESVSTYKAMRKATGKRGAIISRSTYPSSGRYVGHWLGDNHAKWDDLRTTVIGVQEFNMFGIPYVGSDICGFKGTTTEELCLRWQQLGAFHSFSRNHHYWKGPAQDPAVWPRVAKATKKANLFRYHHLPYLFSLHFAASLHGGTVMRPPFFEFPQDEETHNLSYQFLWGSSLMIAPVVQPGVDSVKVYLPKDSQWYSVYDYSYGQVQPSGYETYPAPMDYLIPVFVRGGHILPRQRPGMTTTESRKNELQLLIALETEKGTSAHGELYWDDGESIIDDFATYNYHHWEFTFTLSKSRAVLNITQTRTATDLPVPTMDNIEILGYQYTPDLSTVKLNDQPVAIDMKHSLYDSQTKILNITTMGLINLNSGRKFLLSWNHRGAQMQNGYLRNNNIVKM
uniref:P-type domain-containing protein n=1 Tax=Acrobeloides nanus TaxID=290746 RepID=A0A914EEX1_9BILA